jgi:hypothetical protein
MAIKCIGVKKIMKRNLIFAIIGAAWFTASAVKADNGGFAIAGKAGTLGLGGEASVNLFQDINFRAGFCTFPFDYDSTVNGIDYKFKIDLQTIPLMIDWYPFHDSFHLTGGIILNNTDVDLRARSSGSVEVGGTTYTADQAGTLYGNVGFNRVAPYVGLGWGNPFGHDSRLGLLCDLGVAFSGTPDVSLRANGTYADNPTFQSSLAQEQRDIQSKVDKYKFYPVLSVSLYYRF